MAVIENLFNSGRGRLGNLVFYKMNGQGIVRTKPAQYKDRKSPAQLAQRQRLQVVNRFLKPFSALLKITFPPETTGRTARTEAFSYIMRNALTGDYPIICIDKSKVLLCRGPLPLPERVTVTAQSDGLLIEWENGSKVTGSRAGDTLILMAYSEVSGMADFRFTDTCRTAETYLWKPALPEADLDVWIAFRNRADRHEQQ